MDARARLIVRGFVDGKKVFEDRIDVEPCKLGVLAERHARRFIDEDLPFMVEIEFVDEPDPEKKYFRFGTDLRGMVSPLATTWGEMAKRPKVH